MKVLRRIGIEERVRATSLEPYSHLNRQWDTGEVITWMRGGGYDAWNVPVNEPVLDPAS
jgi:hypothetical protein